MPSPQAVTVGKPTPTGVNAGNGNPGMVATTVTASETVSSAPVAAPRSFQFQREKGPMVSNICGVEDEDVDDMFGDSGDFSIGMGDA